jgi:putative transcriptional regulator
LFSGELVTVVLRLARPFDQGVSGVQHLRAARLTLRAAFATLNRLKDTGVAICRIAKGANIPELAVDLARMNVRLLRRRHPDPDLIVHVRSRHGLSQREFAEILEIDIGTLQNWEQGRDKPDGAAINLVMAFDKSPELIEQTLFEPVI